MKILLAVDGSPCSDGAIASVAERPWPEGSELEVLTVVHTSIPAIPEPGFAVAAAHEESLRQQRHDAPQVLAAAVARIQRGPADLTITRKTLEGAPVGTIVREAADWGADLVVVGCHGHGAVRQALLGSTATGVAAEAACAVEIVRSALPSVTVSAPR